MRARLAAVLVSMLGALASGCGGDEGVVRVVDGDVLLQRVTPPESYASFLAGTLAEADGKFDVAAARYKDAIVADNRDPLLWAKYGEALCRVAPQSKDVDDAFRRAIALDPEFSAIAEARSSCDARRNRAASATNLARQAAEEDPQRPALDARASTLAAVDAEETARARMLAATRVFAERPEAWEALVAFALAHHDAFLADAAAENLLHVRASHFDTGARVAIALAGFGELELAREIAHTTMQKKPDGRALDSLVSRLAVDAAIADGDVADVERIAPASRVSLGEAAARAWIAGKNAVARALAEEVENADPDDADAAIVLSALRRDVRLRPKHGAEGASRSPTAEISSAAYLVLTQVLLEREGKDAARAFAASAKHAAIDGRDALLVESSVALSSAGVTSPESDAERVELALRQGVAPKILPALDERHELAARLLADSGAHDDASRAREARLKMALSREIGRDWLVTYARVESSRRGGTIGDDERAAIFRVAPCALVLSLRIAIADGAAREDDKRRLRAIAITDQERRIAGM